ncbi:RDD family protein [Cohnella terricola]|uniref:RDD family protein n=1 Tax=Cohnella terricola TaxID=1289167 RepID=A0A559JWM5_9BACL|nr:RDD family protein [Cohnella terricola]TVY04291.1 RDD family protein [Cohnella terricola]
MEQENDYAGFWIRLFAFLIDSVLFYGVVWVFGRGGLNGQTGGLLFSLYLVVATLFFGRTIGKLVVGIRVIRQNGENPPWWVVILREVLGKWLSALLLGFGFLMAGFDGQKRALHDHIGRTYVVKTR